MNISLYLYRSRAFLYREIDILKMAATIQFRPLKDPPHSHCGIKLQNSWFKTLLLHFVDHRSAKYHGYSKNVRLCFTMKLAIVCRALQVYQSMNLIYLERRQQWHTTVCCLKTTILLGPRNSSTVEITVIDFLSGSSLSFLLFIVYLNFWICKWYRSNSEESYKCPSQCRAWCFLLRQQTGRNGDHIVDEG